MLFSSFAISSVSCRIMPFNGAVLRTQQTATCVNQCSKNYRNWLFTDSLHAPTSIVRSPKSLRALKWDSRRNSLDISKAEIQAGMSEFDPAQRRDAVSTIDSWQLVGKKPALTGHFAHSRRLSSLWKRATLTRISRKSPADIAEIPTLGRLSAETISIPATW